MSLNVMECHVDIVNNGIVEKYINRHPLERADTSDGWLFVMHIIIRG